MIFDDAIYDVVRIVRRKGYSRWNYESLETSALSQNSRKEEEKFLVLTCFFKSYERNFERKCFMNYEIADVLPS